jgi:hypothetical protein
MSRKSLNEIGECSLMVGNKAQKQGDSGLFPDSPVAPEFWSE